jgi:hypothetical protein
VTAVAWLMNDGDRFMESRLEPLRLPNYDDIYEEADGENIRYVYHIKRDFLMTDLIKRILNR